MISLNFGYYVLICLVIVWGIYIYTYVSYCNKGYKKSYFMYTPFGGTIFSQRNCNNFYNKSQEIKNMQLEIDVLKNNIDKLNKRLEQYEKPPQRNVCSRHPC
jgi:sensor histidine kinase YesM